MTAPTTRAVTLPDGSAAPGLGMGTRCLGESSRRPAVQVDALRAGELEQLDRVCPPPFRTVPLDVLQCMGRVQAQEGELRCGRSRPAAC